MQTTSALPRGGRLRVVAALATCLLAVAGVGPALAAGDAVDRWSPPEVSQDPRFPTMDLRWSDGAVSTSVIPHEQLPLRMVVEKEVAAAIGTDRIAEGLAGWNGIAGSRFSASLVGTVDERVREARTDGVNRIFLDDACTGEELGWGYVNLATAENRYGARGGYTVDADIGLCQRVLDRPESASSTVRHELGHLMGLGHVAEPCRVMSERNDNCDHMSAAEHDAARYLYPRMPRLSGPTRYETSARSSYATHPADNRARTVVLVDGGGSSELPVTAAAHAGAIGAPMLLAHRDCATAPTGAELARSAAPGAEVLLVGAAMTGCVEGLRQRGYRPVAVPSVADVADRFPSDVDTVFVVRGAMSDGNLPDGLTAAAAAGRLGAPILLTEGDELAAWSRSFLRSRPRIRRAVIVGGEQAVPAGVADQLRGMSITPERRGGPDRIATALSIAATPGAFAPRGPALVVSSQTWADAVAGSAIGAAEAWPVVLTPGHVLDGRVAAFLSERATEGFVMGGRAAITDDVLIAVNAQLR